MNEDLIRWNEEADDWINTVNSSRTLAPELLKPIWPRLLHDISGKKILDAGCGEGKFIPEFLKAGAEVTGLDGSENLIAAAKSKYPRIKFVVGDLLAPMPFAERSFDNVFSMFVLMSLSQIDTFLTEAFRILTPGGRLTVCVFHPSFNFPTMRLYRSIFSKLTNGPVRGLATNYFQKTKFRKDDQGRKPWPFYHRTMEEYMDAFINAGFQLKKLYEPHELDQEYLKLHPKHEYATRLPRFIIFDLHKV